MSVQRLGLPRRERTEKFRAGKGVRAGRESDLEGPEPEGSEPGEGQRWRRSRVEGERVRFRVGGEVFGKKFTASGLNIFPSLFADSRHYNTFLYKKHVQPRLQPRLGKSQHILSP